VRTYLLNLPNRSRKNRFHFKIFPSGFKNNQISGQLNQIYHSSIEVSECVDKKKVMPTMPTYKHRDFHQQPSLIHHQFIGDAYEWLERIKHRKRQRFY
jgi:hypothetical protein